MDKNAKIISTVKNMASIISTILGVPAIDTTVTINDVKVFDDKV